MSGTKTYFAPGRVNLIGEHLDYNGGLVLPAAINMGVTIKLTKRKDNKISLRTTAHPFQLEIDLADEYTYQKENDWTNYPLSVIEYLKKEGIQVMPCDLLYESTLPEGSGLSSSAAVEIVTAYALMSQTENRIDKVWLAGFCKQVENDFIGIQCGIMDQYAVAMGKKDHALLLDCKNLKHEYVPVELVDYRLLVMNTKKPRRLVESKYNERKAQCDEALRIIQAAKPDIKNLAEASPIYLDLLADDVLRSRAKHVISENLRVIESVKALQYNDLSTFGRLMNASHTSLKEDYEVSGIELDTLVEAAQGVHGCLGARMTGAGFGGCAIAIVHHSVIAGFIAEVGKQYAAATGLTAEFYDASIEDGVKEITA